MKHAAVKYAELVEEFPNLPDGRGANHGPLARFFGKLLQHYSTSPELPQQAERFALSYIFVVVWTDAGRTTSVKSILDLNVLPKEFQTEATSLLHVIDYKPGTGLAAQRYTSLGHVYPIKGAEAASQLCDGYGRTLHEDVMASDPLYALTEVFNVTTASVNQFLNLIEHKLAGFTDDEHYDDFDMLSNLRYSKDVLYRQQRQLEQTRVQKLQAQCQDAISNLMDNINLKEVRNSYEQSKRIGKLTFLAFLSIWDLQFTRKLLELTAIAIGRNWSFNYN
ncbi:hypothetical protein MHUMG1_10481 [Metarhizium humberi]|uniref:Uncharacterized protein n=1 Tax=Metarhizium humberi TaxID=2596975 RepID=A0A9P8S2N1_9HYPO|nr:hypothetical protein MHUMG1_10481 [Metarhizium humberi]